MSSWLVRRIVYHAKEHRRDFDKKTREVRAALVSGTSVAVAVRSRGREITQPELAKRMLNRILDALNDVPMVVRPPARPLDATIERVLVPDDQPD
jgi:translation initiation factor IF-3